MRSRHRRCMRTVMQELIDGPSEVLKLGDEVPRAALGAKSAVSGSSIRLSFPAPAARLDARGIAERSALSYWQHSDPASAFVDHDEGSSRQICLMLTQGGYDRGAQVVRQDVLSSNLKHARANFVREREHGAKVEVVREQDVLVGGRPIHDLPVGGSRVADSGPVHCLPSLRSQHRHPLGRQVHVQEELRPHGVERGTSCSSSLQAA